MRSVGHHRAPVYCNELYLDLFAKTNPSVLAPKAPNIRGNVIIHKTAQVHPTALVRRPSPGEGKRCGWVAAHSSPALAACNSSDPT